MNRACVGLGSLSSSHAPVLALQRPLEAIPPPLNSLRLHQIRHRHRFLERVLKLDGLHPPSFGVTLDAASNVEHGLEALELLRGSVLEEMKRTRVK